VRIIVEQQLPTDLGTLRQFTEDATRLVDADMTAYVTFETDGSSRWLRICKAQHPSEKVN
jgi:hypothetical protein